MKYILFLSFLFLLHFGVSQSIDLQTISSTGGTSSGGQLQWTTGETIIYGSNTLTQGFHQGKLIITATGDLPDDYEFIAYPNPSQNGFFIKSGFGNNVKITVYDLQGKILETKTKIKLPVFIDISRYQSGIYFVQIENGNQLLKTFKIEKIK